MTARAIIRRIGDDIVKLEMTNLSTEKVQVFALSLVEAQRISEALNRCVDQPHPQSITVPFDKRFGGPNVG